MSLLNRLAFVTGGASGIGKATSKLLAREGASVVIADRNLKYIEAALRDIPKDNQQHHLGVEIDVSNLNSIKKSLKSILDEYKQPPTIIVNCAGITRDNFLLKLSELDFDEVLNVNLKGTFLVIQTFSNSIIAHGSPSASIINIASIVGKYGNIGQANYCASKAGVELLTKTAAKELGKLNIRVNAVLPGMISTPMLEAVPEKVRDKFMKMIPMSRFGKAEEIGEVIAFLASHRSSYVNGASIEVTGGF